MARTHSLVIRKHSAWREGLVFVLALVGLGLVLPIPFVAPINEVQLLRIGGAELSLWLLAGNGVVALLAGAALRRAAGRGAWLARFALAASLVGVGIAAIPGSELPP